jgi:hypothetical protein
MKLSRRMKNRKCFLIFTYFVRFNNLFSPTIRNTRSTKWHYRIFQWSYSIINQTFIFIWYDEQTFFFLYLHWCYEWRYMQDWNPAWKTAFECQSILEYKQKNVCFSTSSTIVVISLFALPTSVRILPSIWLNNRHFYVNILFLC